MIPILNTTPPTSHTAGDGAHTTFGQVSSRPRLQRCSYRSHPDARVYVCEFPAVDTASALTLLVDRSLLVVCDLSIESHTRRPNSIRCDPRYVSTSRRSSWSDPPARTTSSTMLKAKAPSKRYPKHPPNRAAPETARHPPGRRCAAASSSRSPCSSASSFSIRCARLSAALSSCWRSTSGETTAACCRSRSTLAAASWKIRLMVSICVGLSGGTPHQRKQCTGPSR